MVSVDEVDGQDFVVQLHVIRTKGVNRRITIAWVLTGQHNGIYDIYPVKGVVSNYGRGFATIRMSGTTI